MPTMAAQSTAHEMHEIHDLQHSQHDITAMTTGDHECCDQEATTLVCKSGQECKTSSLLQVSVVKVPLFSPDQHAPGLSIDRVPSLAPDVVWHPPRS